MKIVMMLSGAFAALARAILPTGGGGSFLGAVLLLPLAGLLPARVAACNSSMVMVENECLRAEATGIRVADNAVQINKVEICIDVPDRGDPCFLIAKAKVRTYRERNGQEGYQQGGDISVRTFSADQGPHPTECISMGSVSTSPGDKGVSPDAWQIDVETDQVDDRGNPRSVSYNGDF